MQNDLGMDLTKIRWVQAGANAPGREEKVELNLPAGIEIDRVKDKSLSEMLASGELDCAIIARPPTCFLEDHPDIVRLYPDFTGIEEDYYAHSGIWPIMHIVAMKKSVHDAHPWVARNLFNAFQESKRRSIERLLDPAVSRYPLAWLPTYGRKMQGIFGKDPFPFGIEENRKTWEMMGLTPSAGHRTSPVHAGRSFPGVRADQGDHLMPVSSGPISPELIADLAAAARILAARGVVDGFGHVSMRHPNAPGRYLMSRALAPALVTPEDIVEYDLNSDACDPDAPKGFLERFIHGEIYRARPDICSVVHSHSPSVIPFGLTDRAPLTAMFHNAAFLARGAPVFDIADKFGATDMLVCDCTRASHWPKLWATTTSR